MQEKQSRRRGPHSGIGASQRDARFSRIILVMVGILAVLAVISIIRMIRVRAEDDRVSAQMLSCDSTQDIRIFGDSVLYYDGTSIHCVNATGGIRWSYPVGVMAQFSCSDTHVVAWNGMQLYIIDRNGHASYNDSLDSTIQFARVGSNYCAVIVGEETTPTLLIKNMDGTQADFEREEYNGRVIMDVGFYGEADQYLWTLSFDYYAVALSTTLNTYQVARMNTGKVSLGSFLAYRVIYENGRLRVFTTQQMYTYNYKAVPDNSRTMLVHGWQVIDEEVPARGDMAVLMARTSDWNGIGSKITDLRLMNGDEFIHYSLPFPCIGAGVVSGNIYAFSGDNLCYLKISKNDRRFDQVPLPLPEGKEARSVFGLTSNRRAIVACTDGSVYAVTLPK